MTHAAIAMPSLWQQADHGEFTGIDGLTLRYAHLPRKAARGAIVVASGRSEGYLKYDGLAEELHQAGFEVFIWDHRGQGLSDRLSDNRFLGHVQRFNDYVEDMHTFLTEVVQPTKPDKLYLVGHSMGGAIGTLYLLRHPEVFDAAVFSAPMYGIRLPAPRWALEPVLSMLARWNRWQGQPAYIPGGTDYQPVPFEDNDLTQDAERYQAFQSLYQQVPQLQLGSPSNQWMVESFTAMDQIQEQAHRLTTPTLVMQAREDAIVDNDVMERVVARGQSMTLMPLAGARHELLVEIPAIRDQVVDAITQWLGLH
ncbi:alpha/beta fold hydrolase [Ferrimonas sp. SCSIO 43195]|uniref:alpha/beta fold hydrolase n=1 Tax=Ferrimonas sp. SCSIO 43195 TaxID=2822844 RepID=UPI002075013D|nr:alpha/beta fold hydrolase [Ferrimonas sp. SCSIO 43195]USD37457.1 alpha/beta fold hydrolase [Ferrimonas sp. SCSIO 43195]